MLIDGIGGSAAIDKSGEVLDIKGCDVSSVNAGVAYCNYEHRSGDSGTPLDNVGKIIYCKKLYSDADCENDRQRKYWKELELPCIYIVCRLSDEAGHEGAKALAASIRDELKHDEKVMIGFSVEGSTLKRDGNVLKETIIRGVALTLKPCNSSSLLGVLEDPGAPDGFDKKPYKEKKSDWLEEFAESKKSELRRPDARVLSGHLNTFVPMSDELEKTITAGSYNSAPGSLIGGSALQIEDAGLRRRFHVNVAKAAVRDWDKKEPIRPFLKHRLPDADPEFIERFAQAVDDYQLKKAAPKPDDNRPLTIRGKPVRPTPTVEKPHFDEKTGVLRTEKGSVPMYIPGRDKQPGAVQAFHNALNDPAATKIHDYALKNWRRVHDLLKTGKLPDAVVMHATLFSQLSPNTPVPSQELMYGHLVDAMKDTGIDARNPRFPSIKENWTGRDNPSQWPITGGNHYQRIENQLRIKHDSKLTGRKAGEIGSFMLANNKFSNMAEYHKLHGKLTELVGRHKADAQSAVNELMHHKTKSELWDAQRERNKAKGMPDTGDYSGPVVRGLAPKTARYMYGMLGGGNVTVPDTHFVRHLFGLEKGRTKEGGLDNHTIDYLKNLLWNPNNSKVLEGIDRYYSNNHDAVAHTSKNPLLAGVSKTDLTFPSFWKHWMSIVPHEVARGMGGAGSNELTDHKPFWDTVGDLIDQRKGRVTKADLGAYQKAQDSVKEHMHWQETVGDMPALMMYYAFLVPELLGEDENHVENGLELTDTPNGDIEAGVCKAEAFSVAIRTKLGEFYKAEEQLQPQQAPQPISFQGKKVIPGHIRAMADGPGGFQDHAVLGHDDKHFYTVPVHPGKLGDWQPHEVERINRAGQGRGFDILKWPSYQGAGASVDAKTHGDPVFNQTPEQEKMIHGLDMQQGEFKNPGALEGVSHHLNHWRKHPSGQELYIKGEGSFFGGEVNADARNEAAYHNLARDVFGLGHYVPPVSVFTHPITGARASAIAKVIGGEHYKRHDPMHQAAIKNMTGTGDLHRLGFMNFILGSRDRHSGNFLMTPGEKNQLQLIDNSEILSDNSDHTVYPPDYLYFNKGLEKPVAQEDQAWAMGLDDEKLAKSLTDMKYSPGVVQAAIDRMNFVKNTIAHRSPIGGQSDLKMQHIFDPPSRSDKGEW